MPDTNSPPESIADVPMLEDLLSQPTDALVQSFRRLEGDILILGVGGKMGPTLARMARRALDSAGRRNQRILGVARFTDRALRDRLESWNVRTIAADLLDQKQLDALPDTPNIIFMAGMKFGSSGNQPLTWAMNTYLPAMVAQRYRGSRIVAFSTGNIYGLTPISRGGSIETDPPAPVGEYAMSCLGRERILEHFSRTLGTPVTLIRLNYACELRYGVLVDLAQRIWAGRPVSLNMGHFNVIWQADANAAALHALEKCSSPAFILNVTGPELLRTRDICLQLASLLDKPVTFEGEEPPDALLSNASLSHQLFGRPRISIDQLLRWIADWIKRSGTTLNKPTHFEVRDGKF